MTTLTTAAKETMLSKVFQFLILDSYYSDSSFNKWRQSRSQSPHYPYPAERALEKGNAGSENQRRGEFQLPSLRSRDLDKTG